MTRLSALTFSKTKVLNTVLAVFLAGILSLGISAIQPYDAFAGTWKKDSVGWWYKNDNGSYPKNAWQKIGGKWYHFDKKGYMQTGWIKTGGAWYYLTNSGAMTTGWKKDGGKWYYLRPNGKMATGWQKINNKWYYLAGSGAMQTGWIKKNGKWYYLLNTGVMATGLIWYTESSDWYGLYYFGNDGAMCRNKWIYEGDTGWQCWYYFKSDGKAARFEWVGNNFFNKYGEWCEGANPAYRFDIPIDSGKEAVRYFRCMRQINGSTVADATVEYTGMVYGRYAVYEHNSLAGYYYYIDSYGSITDVWGENINPGLL